MSRKDTIIVALLINAGLLALLFMLAINTEDDSVTDFPEISTTLKETKLEIDPSQQAKNVAMEIVKMPTQEVDEVDSFLNELASNDPSQPIVIDEDGYVELVKDSPPETIQNVAKETRSQESGNYIEITVKRGDALEKIARNNGTTIEAIKKANGMTSTKLSIGQVLRIPVNKAVASTTDSKPASAVSQSAPVKPAAKVASTDKGPSSPKPAAAAQDSTKEAVYHTMKNGDTPWKLSKQYNVKFEDLLKLNGLNEEKARNLKPGDKIRVR